jgi:hypothetical protein
MTPQRFRQIRNVFDALMEREPPTRTMFLEEACQGDDELRSEVKRLIAAHEHGSLMLRPSMSRMKAMVLPAKPSIISTNSPRLKQLLGSRSGFWFQASGNWPTLSPLA